MTDQAWTSNSEGCLEALRGRTITGHYLVRATDVCGGIVLVLDDGTGMRFSSNGSYWRVPADEVQRAIGELRQMWERASAEARRLAELAGETATVEGR